MDEREADAVWKHFTDTDKAAKRGHGIGFAAGHSEPFEGAFHEKDSLQARFKRAEAPQDGQSDAEEEPVSVRDRIRARVANAMREGKKHEKTEDSKWTHFTTQKRRELVGLQSIVDDRGRMLGSEYTFTDQDHAELDSAIAAATRKPDAGKAAAEKDHAAAIFGAPMPTANASNTRDSRARSPRDRDHGRSNRHRGEHHDWEHDRERDRQRDRGRRYGGREGGRSRGGDRDRHARGSERDSVRYRDRDRDAERRHGHAGRYDRGTRRACSRSPDRRAGSPAHSRQRATDRRDGGGYRSSRHEGNGREEGRRRRDDGSARHERTHVTEEGYEGGREAQRDRCRGRTTHGEERAERSGSEGHQGRDRDRGRGVVGGIQQRDGGDGACTRLASDGEPIDKGDAKPGVASRLRPGWAATEGSEAAGGSGGVSIGGGACAWAGVVPDGAVVVELEAPRQEVEERHTDLDSKLHKLAKSSWRDRLAARS